MAKKTFKPGDKVTCKHPESAYYGNYGGNPVMTFKPGMVGTVASIAPKIRIIGKDRRGPGRDGKDEFLVVDYHEPATDKTQRCGLDFINAVAVKE